jgi:hypothetical protein
MDDDSAGAGGRRGNRRGRGRGRGGRAPPVLVRGDPFAQQGLSSKLSKGTSSTAGTAAPDDDPFAAASRKPPRKNTQSKVALRSQSLPFGTHPPAPFAAQSAAQGSGVQPSAHPFSVQPTARSTFGPSSAAISAGTVNDPFAPSAAAAPFPRRPSPRAQGFTSRAGAPAMTTAPRLNATPFVSSSAAPYRPSDLAPFVSTGADPFSVAPAQKAFAPTSAFSPTSFSKSPAASNPPAPPAGNAFGPHLPNAFERTSSSAFRLSAQQQQKQRPSGFRSISQSVVRSGFGLASFLKDTNTHRNIAQALIDAPGSEQDCATP